MWGYILSNIKIIKNIQIIRLWSVDVRVDKPMKEKRVPRNKFKMESSGV